MCTSPLWIRNRRYYKRDITFEEIAVQLAEHPGDLARQRLLVPCGQCEECLRDERNAWYVRLERELARCRDEHRQAVFVTVTISPKLYAVAVQFPSAFIRAWNERVRRAFGKSIKHAFFQEFGSHPLTGNVPRLHFHGFLFDLPCSYAELRRAIGDLGYIWISKASHRRARYCVKYILKDVGAMVPEYLRQRDWYNPRIYRRKFVSAHVGDYLGRMPRPSLRVSTWSYLDFARGTRFRYRIPRYYDKYMAEEDKQARELLSSWYYSHACVSSLVCRIVDKLAEIRFGASTLARWRRYSYLSPRLVPYLRTPAPPHCTGDLPSCLLSPDVASRIFSSIRRRIVGSDDNLGDYMADLYFEKEYDDLFSCLTLKYSCDG